MSRTFRNLAVWRRPVELATEAHRVAASMPDTERFDLTSQMRHAAVFVSSSISEGAGRATRPDVLPFLRTSRGSRSELQTQLPIALTLKMIEPHVRADELLSEPDRVPPGLIRGIEERESEDQIA